MMLYRQDLTEEMIQEYFPSLLEIGYRYGLELTTLKPQGKKSFDGAHLSAYRYREQEFDGRTMIIRELAVSVPCVRIHFDKPLRESQREKIVGETGVKMREKIERVGLSDNHPYKLALQHI